MENPNKMTITVNDASETIIIGALAPDRAETSDRSDQSAPAKPKGGK